MKRIQRIVLFSGSGNFRGLAIGIAAGFALTALFLSQKTFANACTQDNALGLIQSSYGSFEVVTPAANGGLAHYWRDNSTDRYNWSPAARFSSGDVRGVSLIQSNYATNGSGHLEAVATVGANLVIYTRDDGGTWQWSAPLLIGTGVRGTPGFVQGKWGTHGNFEVVVPSASGGLAHYWRNNDDPAQPWYGPIRFGNVAQLYDAVSVVQTNIDQGNLEIVARTGTTLHHFWRDDGANWQWHGPAVIGTGAQGSPGFYQSRNGTKGNYELLTPMVGGGLAHYWRNNDDPAYPWYGPYPVPGTVGNATSVSAIRSRFGLVGNLEWVAQIDGELKAGLRDDAGTWSWLGPYPFSSQVCCVPNQKGRWDTYDTDIVGIHTVLMRTGNVLFYGITDTDDTVGMSRVFNPTTGAISATTHSTAYHPIAFCSGQSALADGRIYVVGGHAHHVATTDIFDPITQNWSAGPTMTDGRWYPTTATLSNGQVFIIAGTRITGREDGNIGGFNNTWQIFNPASGTLTPQQPVPYPFSADNFGPIDLYPFVYLLPDNRLFVHSRNSSRFINPNTGVWETTRYDTVRTPSRSYPGTGTSVLLPLEPTTVPPYRPRIMLIGGAGSSTPDITTPATAATEVLDLGAPAPQWTPLAPMNYPRVMADSVLMPDGKIFVVGGSSVGRADRGVHPVLTPEIYDPAANAWTKLCTMTVPRSYHATGLLLPDARILVAGKDGLFNEVPYRYPEHRVEIFSPPYLFQGTRPAITSGPETITYGANFYVGVGQVATNTVGRVALIRLGSSTHSLNMDQRYVGLNFAVGANGLTLQAPPNAAIAPPGYYMLFVVTSTGIPSVARMVRLG